MGLSLLWLCLGACHDLDVAAFGNFDFLLFGLHLGWFLLLLLGVEAFIEGLGCALCLLAGVLTVGGLPTMLFLFGNDRQVLFLSLDHDGLAFEEVVDQQVAYFPLEDVAGFVVVPLAVDWAPVAHVLHRVVDRLREGRDIVGVLQDRGYFFEVEHQVVHPNWTGENVLIVL